MQRFVCARAAAPIARCARPVAIEFTPQDITIFTIASSVSVPLIAGMFLRGGATTDEESQESVYCWDVPNDTVADGGPTDDGFDCCDDDDGGGSGGDGGD